MLLRSDAIHHSMCRLLSDDELKTRLVSKGRESVKIFSLQNMINKLRAVYFISS